MVPTLTRSIIPCTISFLTLPALTLQAGGVPANRQPLAQIRINELAAYLLRGHRALIEEPGLRRADEPLNAYMERIAAPLSGETQAHYRCREETYVAALERTANPRNLCVTVPALRDSSAPNVENWTRAVRASADLQSEVARVRAEWTAEERTPPIPGRPRHLGAHFTRSLLLIKGAYEALRDARP